MVSINQRAPLRYPPFVLYFEVIFYYTFLCELHTVSPSVQAVCLTAHRLCAAHDAGEQKRVGAGNRISPRSV